MDIALCAIGRRENRYAREFVEHYLALGFDHIFICDNNHDGEERFEDVLQEHGGLAHTAGAFDAYEAGIPVDLGIEIALESQVNLGELAMIGIEQGL